MDLDGFFQCVACSLGVLVDVVNAQQGHTFVRKPDSCKKQVRDVSKKNNLATPFITFLGVNEEVREVHWVIALCIRTSNMHLRNRDLVTF